MLFSSYHVHCSCSLNLRVQQLYSCPKNILLYQVSGLFKKKKKDRRSLTHTLNSQVDLALSFLGLFAWREVRSSDGDGSFRVFTDPLQSFFRCHLPPGSLREGRKGRFYKPFFVCFMFRGRNKILWDSWLLISRDKKHKTLSLSICHLKDKPLTRTKSICIEHKHFAKN